MKLLFMDREDVFNTWGQLRFRAAVLEQVAELEPDPAVSPDFTVRCCVPQVDGSYVVYACDGGRDHKPWQIYRYRTDDGIHLQAKERVYQSEPGRWSQTTTLNYSPEEDLFLCLKNMKVDDGGSTYAYLSRDGERWDPCPANPVYVEGDRWGCVWSSAVQRFITYNKGIQRYAGKLTPELLYGGVGLSERWDARRVVTIRTSRGRVPLGAGRSRLVTTRHAGDRRGQAVRWPGGAAGVPDHPRRPGSARSGVLRRIRLRVRGALLHEHDELRAQPAAGGLTGRRPRRSRSSTSTPSGGSAATGCAGSVRSAAPTRSGTGWPSFSTTRWWWMVSSCSTRGTWGASRAGGRCWAMAHEVWGVPEDRLTGVTSRSNAVFETTRFAMPRGPLKLNAKIPGDGYPGGGIQSYVMAELIDDCDRIVPGYERHRCRLLPPQDSLAIELDWQGNSGAELAGRTVRIRFFMRAADLFAVTA